MTGNQATGPRVKRLRELLDERGIVHYDHEDGEPPRVSENAEEPATSWHVDGASYCAVPDCTGTFDIWIFHCTLEQAIAATLGSEREKALEELVRDWQVLAEARLDDEIALLKRITELEGLVRDMWEFGESSNYPYTPLESVRWAQMREEYRERIAALGMEVDG